MSLIFLVTADVFALIEFGGITGGFFFMLTIGGQLYLRWKKPELERPFKVNYEFLRRKNRFPLNFFFRFIGPYCDSHHVFRNSNCDAHNSRI